MKLTFCVARGSVEDLQRHHLVALSEGGNNDETNLITLCYGCHAKLHKRQAKPQCFDCNTG
jgi:5-methylcytosine-specific restriction endonuclease McrA